MPQSRPDVAAWLAGTLAALASFTSTPAMAQDSRTLLAIFAHADDEQVVSPMLARYAREGVRVYLAIATDGQKGVRPHAGLSAGEPLAAARVAEARCACERLGIHPPILLGLEDGALHANENKARLLEHVTKLLGEVRPDVVVTWGPDGVTGHTDHRIVSNIVTEVVLRGGPHVPRALFYAGLASDRMPELRQAASDAVPPGINTVHGRFLSARIPYTEADAKAAAESLACHKTQYTPAEVAMMSRMGRFLENGTVRLRPVSLDPQPVTDLFPPE